MIVELESVERALPVHSKQALTPIKLADVRVGLLLNFGAERINDGITRLVHRFPEQPLCVSAALREPFRPDHCHVQREQIPSITGVRSPRSS